MFVITGITGQVGGSMARQLLSENKKIRAVVRNADKGEEWARQGCEVAIAEIDNAERLTAAFRGAEGVFVLLPSSFDPSPDFSEVKGIIKSLMIALTAARPEKVVFLSTIGAQVKQYNLLSQLGLVEQAFEALPLPVTFLRPAWFMENSAWDIAPALETGVIQSFLQPLDKPVPMVATNDVGRLAAELIQQVWDGKRIVELEGPRRVTPAEIGAAFSKLLERRVDVEIVARNTWESLFKSQGMKNPEPRINMLDGFNEGWIEFENGEAGSRKGTTTIETVLQKLIEAANTEGGEN